MSLDAEKKAMAAAFFACFVFGLSFLFSKMALEIANRAYVLETGTIKMEGEANELANNIEVRKAYLGCE